MDVHKNARTLPHSRAIIARRIAAGEPVAVVAREFQVCDRTARKWALRGAQDELSDRSCRPHHSPRAISAALMVEIQRLRALEWTGVQIAEVVGVSRATVGRTLRQLGLGQLEALHSRPLLQRYEWPQPGQLLHFDTKKLGRIGHMGHRITGDRRRQARGIGWEFVHVCVDDCSRVSYAEVLADDNGPSVAAFLRRAVAWFRRRGVRVHRVLTDNGSGYRSRVFAAACRARRLAHRRTRGPIPRARTAKPSVSSVRCCASGPTGRRSIARRSAPPPWIAGCTTTIGTAAIARWAVRHRSAESSGLTIC